MQAATKVRDDYLRAAGDASRAVLSLFLAASAGERHCDKSGDPGPLGRKRLAEVIVITKARGWVMAKQAPSRSRRPPAASPDRGTWGLLTHTSPFGAAFAECRDWS